RALESMSGETVTVLVTTWMLPRPATDGLCLWYGKELSIFAKLASIVPRRFLRPDSLSSWRFVNNELLPTLSRPCLFL
ncbi:hypothetical protein AMECASPLE_039353, partial [Ameca splendens]